MTDDPLARLLRELGPQAVMAAQDEAERYACAFVMMHISVFLQTRTNAENGNRPWRVSHVNDWLVTSHGGVAKSYGMDANAFEAPLSDPPPNVRLRNLHIATLIVRLTSEPHNYSPNDLMPSTERYILARRTGALVAFRDTRIRTEHLRQYGGRKPLPTPSEFHTLKGDNRLAMAEFEAMEDAAEWGFPDTKMFSERHLESPTFRAAMKRRGLAEPEPQHSFLQALVDAYWDDLVVLDLALESPGAGERTKYKTRWPFLDGENPGQSESRT